ncbi:MAG: outer membrane lipoprotein carrier protein LolA [Bacteroidales bacterium]|nr:outer membrane lipoprotein carrier protein LolA [Bacteroidales bacterium]
MKKILTFVIAMLALTASAQKVEAHFTESKFIKASGKTIEAEGKLKLFSADKMELRYTKPAGDYFIIDGKTVSTNLRGKKSVVDTEKNTAMRTFRNTLMNCVNCQWKQAATDNDAETSVAEKGANKVVTLSAKKTAPRGYSKIVITYRKSDNIPVELVFEEFNGTVTTYKISDIVKK